MTELKIPAADVLQRQLSGLGRAEKTGISAMVDATLKAYRTKFNADDHPICGALGEAAFNRICNYNTDLMEQGKPAQERLDAVTAMLDKEIAEKVALGSSAAEKLEKELAKLGATSTAKLAGPDQVTAFLNKSTTWFSFIKDWFSIENRHYSSVRGGSASGETGKGLSKKWRTLRVAATTVANNVTTKLFGFPIGSKTTIGCLVISTHFRAPYGVIPTAGNPLVAGAVRNGNTQSNSGNSWIVSKATLFIDNDPNLTNLTYFGSSSDAGISLYVSGTP